MELILILASLNRRRNPTTGARKREHKMAADYKDYLKRNRHQWREEQQNEH